MCLSLCHYHTVLTLEDDVLTIDDYSVVFSEPQMYTLVQVKRDRFTPLALLGGLITMIGLIMALYLQPVRAWAVQQPDGMWTVCAVSRRGGALFRERFEEAVSAAMMGDGTDASA